MQPVLELFKKSLGIERQGNVV